MPAIKLEQFQGLIPRSSPRLLPPMAATIARNTKLLNGEIRGFREPREIANLVPYGVSPVRRAVRIVDNSGSEADTWLVFNSQNVDVVRSPIINDLHDRYFWAGDGRPMMNTSARIFNGDPGYYLGIPTPTVGPSITPPAGTDETRAYVYTFLSAYGEEGPPSPPTLATGNAGTWELEDMNTTVPDASNRNIVSKRIYRTVSGGNSTNFFFVAEITLAAADYSDAEPSTTVASNNLLESTSFIEPPVDLQGMVVMPNGYLAGWVGRRLVFSEPYRPHAWPAEYELSTEYPIVGLVVWGATLVIGTMSQPYFGQGNSPLAFTLQKLDAVEPCLSRRGMVATVAGAYYPSINGLVLANSNGAQVITQDILTKEEWGTYNPGDLFAAQLGLQYIAFNSENFGIIFNPTEPGTKLVELDSFDNVAGIETDRYSGNVLLIVENKVLEWDTTSAERLNWRWMSKVYQFPKPLNFGAARMNFLVGTEDISVDVINYYGSYNEDLFAAVPSGSVGSSGDEFFSNVQLLAKFEGSDGATAYTEVSTNGGIGTFAGDAEIDTAQFAFGSSSLLLDGTGDYVSFPDIAGFDLGAGDWTIEAFVRFNSIPTSGNAVCLVSQWGAGGDLFAMQISTDGFGTRVRGTVDGSGTELGTIVPTPSLNTWYHMVMQRSGDDWRIGFNGNLEMSANGVFSGALITSSEPIRIGSLDGSSNFLDGWIDNVRITVGVGRYDYTGNVYTVPAADFPEQGDVAGVPRRGLNTLNGHALNGSPAQARGLVPGWLEPETRQPLGGSLLYPLDFMSFQTLAVRLRIHTRNNVVFDKVLYNENIVRLPTGFKSDIWQFELLGNTNVYSLQAATTPRQLKVS
jgi:hypothetical protein